MLTQIQVEQIIANLISIYEDIENELLRNISKKLSVTDNIDAGSVGDWQLKKLDELGFLTKENSKIITGYSGRAQAEIEQILKNAGYLAADADDKIFMKAFDAGILKEIPLPARSSAAIQQILQAAISNAKNKFNLINTAALQGASQDYIKIINQAYLETSLGVYDYNTSIRKAVAGLADKGISTVTYISNTSRRINTPVDVAVRRSVLTSTSQIAGEIQLQRAQEWGSDYVEVSSHMGARPSHAEWQGRVYKLNGSAPGYPNFAETTGYGTVEGLKGINCRHDFYPFFPGISEQTFKPYNQAENDKAYEESQEQRRLENEIRKEKRRIIAADESGDTEGLTAARVRLKTKKDNLYSFLDRTGRTPRTNRTQVMGFGHSQASSATTAAKKAAASHSGNASELNVFEGKGKKSDINKLTENTANTKSSLSDSAIQSRRKDEKIMTGYKKESAVLYDSQGNKLFKKAGEEHSVEFTYDEIKQMRGGILTHNHPYGASFSPSDINVLRVTGLSEIRASTVSGVHVLKQPGEWDPKLKGLSSVKKEYDEIYDNLKVGYLDKVRKNEISFHMADIAIQKETIKTLSEKFGLEYSFESW